MKTLVETHAASLSFAPTVSVGLGLDELYDVAPMKPVTFSRPASHSPPMNRAVRSPPRRSTSSTKKIQKMPDAGMAVSKATQQEVSRYTKRRQRSNRKLPNRSVSFDKVQVREFQQILGDAPARDNGPSIGLGWEYQEKEATKVDQFEQQRSPVRLSPLSPQEREERARALGFSTSDIERNRWQNIKINEQRKKIIQEYEMDNGPLAVFKRAQRGRRTSL